MKNYRQTIIFGTGCMQRLRPACAILAVVLAACSEVPGQRFTSPPSIPQTGGEYSSEPEQQKQIPIVDINVELLKKMNDAPIGALDAKTLSLFGKPTAYTLGPGDVLQITVWDHPELAAALGQVTQTTRTSDPAPGVLVDSEGNIEFPYAGTMHVEGQDVETVQRELRRRLGQVFLKPEVTVRIASFRASQVYIDGEVRTPGSLQMNDIPMSLTEAVGRAGGFTDNADQGRLELVRGGVVYPLNVEDLISHGHNPSEIYLHAGDLLRVSPRDEHGIYLMGEVNRPATILPMRDGKLTLSEALSQAGSINPNTAYAKQLYVIRNSMGDKPEIFHLDATSPVSMLLANQFELQPKDVVYVDNNGLVRFNRVLNLLLPAINAGVTSALLTK